ncbi:response regulator [Oscillatoria laete-virens NRMC-F 0139]|nr:response regulator [Oscillatoria laete-virens]MDL5054705.1 response regulator [Oscillatoria laete-virens NRMC-F 0139]
MNGKSIVIVDDEAIIAETLQSLLEIKTDFNVKVFTESAAALEFIRGNPLDLLLTDYYMPNLSGLDLIKESRGIHPELPVIVLTGYYNPGEMDHLAESDDKITIMLKPWNSAALIDKIRSLLAD